MDIIPPKQGVCMTCPGQKLKKKMQKHKLERVGQTDRRPQIMEVVHERNVRAPFV